jgi:hypothetical protein
LIIRAQSFGNKKIKEFCVFLHFFRQKDYLTAKTAGKRGLGEPDQTTIETSMFAFAVDSSGENP